MEKAELANRQNLLCPIPACAQWRDREWQRAAQSKGSTAREGNNTVSAWRIRPKTPVGIKVDLQGHQCIGALVDFALLRTRDFNGILFSVDDDAARFHVHPDLKSAQPGSNVLFDFGISDSDVFIFTFIDILVLFA